jgi:hypothetical protein
MPLKFSPSGIDSNLDAGNIMKSDMFCYYCCCGGVALGPVGSPFIAAEAKELCLHSTVQCTDIMNEKDGLCSMMSVMCCVTEQCQLPPLANSHKCVCCNQKIAPGGTVSKTDEIIKDYGGVIDGTFWLYYIFCMGCGLSGIAANDRPLYGMVKKDLCIRESVEINLTEIVDPDGTMCAVAATELCFWSQCQFPPQKEQPLFACFTFKKERS